MSEPSRELDESMMRRALRLAMNGRGRVEPNPMVGCIITKNARVIGEGFHRAFGEAHAEPNALASCTESPDGATAYVTLEPCCHTQKKTPPCTPRLIQAKLRRVVIGCLDPNPQVNGQGVAMLRQAGIQVSIGVLEAEARQLIAPFIAATEHGRPYVTAKWAQTRNGKVAGRMGQRIRITNDTSNALIHTLRGRCDAIAVGTNTVLSDDPLLTARPPGGASRMLLRVVLSNTLKIPLTSQLVRTARQTPVIAYCSEASLLRHAGEAEQLRAAGVEIVALPDHDSHFSFADVLKNLNERRVTNLLIEPGPTLTGYLMDRGQVDRLWIFRSPIDLNDADGLAISSARVPDYPSTGTLDLAGDMLTEYLNPSSAVFFTRAPSADLVCAA